MWYFVDYTIQKCIWGNSQRDLRQAVFTRKRTLLKLFQRATRAKHKQALVMLTDLNNIKFIFTPSIKSVFHTVLNSFPLQSRNFTSQNLNELSEISDTIFGVDLYNASTEKANVSLLIVSVIFTTNMS